jgi:hypothetical protein
MKTKRSSIPKKLQNQVSDQCGYACANPKCRNPRSSRHQFHHIDENPENNVIGNLILLCAGCHSDHHQGTVSTSDILLWKRMAESGYLPAPTMPTGQFQPLVHENHGIVGHNVHVEKFTVNAPSRKSGSAPPLPGTIGADADMRDYANYLVKRYIEWRKKGIAHGTDRRKFSPAAASSVLAQGFGSQTVLMIPAHQFSEWVGAAQSKIDKTIWGRNNVHRNYHTWDEHLKTRHGTKNDDDHP